MQSVFPAYHLYFYFLLWMLVAHTGGAQNLEMRSALANVSQDIALLDRELRSLKLEVQLLSEQKVVSEGAVNMQSLSGRLKRLEEELSSLKRALSEQENAIKTAVLTEVSEAMEDYFSEIKVLLTDSTNNLSPTNPRVRSEQASGVKTEFSENFPKSGISYEVQSGDTLSQIALKFGSKVAYIQDANQIVNPARDLRVGDVIFIPLTED